MCSLLLLICISLLALLVVPSHAADWSVANLTILAITSPQCQNNPTTGQALDCTLPATLTIVTSAVPTSPPTNVYQFGLNIRLLPYVDFNLDFKSLSTTVPPIFGNSSTSPAPTNSTWQLLLLLPGYVQPALGSLLNVSFYSSRDFSRTSPAFAGISLLSSPPPRLDSISGCSGSGLSTLQCNVETDTLTLHGSGFHWVEAMSFYSVTIGTCIINMHEYGRNWGDRVDVLSDTLATFSLSRSYESCAYPTPSYDGRTLPFSINLSWRTPSLYGAVRPSANTVLSNALNFSYALCPPPTVWHFSCGVCDETPIWPSSNTSGPPDYHAYTDCTIAGPDSGISILGTNMDSAYILVGNDSVGWYRPSTLYLSGSGGLWLHPIAVELLPYQLYDVKVVNDGGEYVLPRRISYANSTQVVSVDRCSDRSGVEGLELGCEPGQPITIRGVHFPYPCPPTAVTIDIVKFEPEMLDNTLNATCMSIAVLDPTTITCVPPTLSTLQDTEWLYGRAATIQITFNNSADTVVVTNALQVDLFVNPLSAYISNVSGCGVQNGLRNLSSCHSGDLLTMYGGHLDELTLLGGSLLSELPVDILDATSNFALTCVLLPRDDNYTDDTGNLRRRQCQLPVFDGGIDGDSIYEGERYEFVIVLYPFNLYEAFSLDFASVQPDSPSASAEGAALSSGAVAGVAVAAVVGVVAVLALLVVLSRRWSGLRGGGRATDASVEGDSSRWKALRNNRETSRGVELPTSRGEWE